MKQTHTITIFSENKPGILYRVAGLFLKRKINIESLTVSETGKKGISRFTIVIEAEPEEARKVTAQVNRVIEVHSAVVNTDEKLIAREITLVRIAPKDEAETEKIATICNSYRAHILDETTGNGDIVVEIDGSEDKIDACMNELRQFEITEFVRSGRVAIIT